MSDRTSYWIPVGWHVPMSTGLGTITELHSHAGVIVPPNHSDVRYRDEEYDVTRIHGAWSRHIPEKKPRYRVEVGSKTFEAEPVRLGTVPVDHFFLVPLRTGRKQVCLRRGGVLHGVAHNVSASYPWTFCGISEHLRSQLGSDGRYAIDYDEHFVRGETPTCKACLAHEAVWCLFVVLPHTKKGEVLKRTAKEKSAEERRLKLPTAYDRILDDELFERPTYKAVKAPASPPEPVDVEDIYEADPRDRKRSSAIDRQRRLEDSKARVQGHRR